MRWIFVAIAIVGCGEDPPPTDITCRPSIVYLNRDGGVFAPGAHDDSITNTSVLVDVERTLAPWPNDYWPELVTCMRDHLAQFPRIEVTEIDPGTVPHVEIVFTDTYWASSATTMIVPASCRLDHEVELVFGTALPTNARACQVALQGFAEMTANLSFDDNCHDLVNNSIDCAPDRAFLDETVNCVDVSGQPAPCRCGDTTQNTYRALLAAFPTCP